MGDTVSSMSGKPLRIAWFGLNPLDTGGAPGVATELLYGLAQLGHRIDCFLPGTGARLPAKLAADERLTFVWVDGGWRWNRWYSKNRITAFTSGLLARSLTSLRLRREVMRRHRREPYDVLFQASSIESLAVPSRLTRTVPLVIRPDTHMAGELRSLIAERRLSLRCQPAYTFAIVAAIMFVRAAVQRVKVRRASLLICISSVFRDHIVRDYRFPLENTVVITNPARLERFADADLQRGLGEPPTVLAPTRVSVRKGIEDLVAVAQSLPEHNGDVRLRIVGGPSLWSDYTRLLDDLPPQSSEYAGSIAPAGIPQEFAHSDVMLLPSKYDPCPMSVIEALCAGVPVIATSEVGSIENVDRSVVTEVAPGDVDGMVAAITQMLEQLRGAPAELRARARAEAERRFAPSVVCGQIALALEQLVERTRTSAR